ncbi:MAG: hypothetical protein LBJ92_01660 [Holosporales bacterium]|jgi:hypothetical protein|nr:hypothetical protein [Holosporales bacterium]
MKLNKTKNHHFKGIVSAIFMMLLEITQAHAALVLYQPLGSPNLIQYPEPGGRFLHGLISTLADSTQPMAYTLIPSGRRAQTEDLGLTPKDKFIAGFLTTPTYELGFSRGSGRIPSYVQLVFPPTVAQAVQAEKIRFFGFSPEVAQVMARIQNIRFETSRRADELCPLEMAELGSAVLFNLAGGGEMAPDTSPILTAAARKAPRWVPALLERMAAVARAAQQDEVPVPLPRFQPPTEDGIFQILHISTQEEEPPEPVEEGSSEDQELPEIPSRPCVTGLPYIQPQPLTLPFHYKACYDRPDLVAMCWLEGGSLTIPKPEDQVIIHRIFAGNPLHSDDEALATGREYARWIREQTSGNPFSTCVRLAIAVGVHCMGKVESETIFGPADSSGNQQSMAVLVVTSPFISPDGKLIIGPGNPAKIPKYCASFAESQHKRERLPLSH